MKTVDAKEKGESGREGKWLKMGANEKGMKEEKWEKNKNNECESEGKKKEKRKR